jgi:exodeoxyribonuclease V alpha subunit
MAEMSSREHLYASYINKKTLRWTEKYYQIPAGNKKTRQREVRQKLREVIEWNPFVVPYIPQAKAEALYKQLGCDEKTYKDKRLMGIIHKRAWSKSRGEKLDFKTGKVTRDYEADIGISVDQIRLGSNQAKIPSQATLVQRYENEYHVKLALTSDSKSGRETFVVCDKFVWYAESRVYDYLTRQTRLSRLINVNEEDVTNALEDLNKDPDSHLVQAVLNSCHFPVSLVFGEPGTGKSVVIETLCALCTDLDIDVRVCSFTGKAIANLKGRITGRTRATFSTAHSLYKSYRDLRNYQKSRENTTDSIYPTGSGVLIIEEASMMSTSLFSSLVSQMMKARHRLQVILVGDHHQLPPIGWGRLFESLLRAPIMRSELKTNYRTRNDWGTTIVQNSRLYIRESMGGETISSAGASTKITWHPEYFYFDPGDHIRDYIQMYYQDPKDYQSVMIVSPWNKRKNAINTLAQSILRGADSHICFPPSRKWYVNDKVIITRNSPTDNVFNGSLGIIRGFGSRRIKLDDKDGVWWALETTKSRPRQVYDCEIRVSTLEIDTLEGTLQRVSIPLISRVKDPQDEEEDDILTGYLRSLDADDVDLAYCYTIHKAQGSESIIVILDCYHMPHCGYRYVPGGIRNIYTAITRTKRCFIYNGYLENIDPLLLPPSHATHDCLRYRLQIDSQTIRQRKK